MRCASTVLSTAKVQPFEGTLTPGLERKRCGQGGLDGCSPCVKGPCNKFQFIVAQVVPSEAFPPEADGQGSGTDFQQCLCFERLSGNQDPTSCSKSPDPKHQDVASSQVARSQDETPTLL